MNSLFCYCCQGLLNIFPQNNKGKRVMWNITIDNNSQDQVLIEHLDLYLSLSLYLCMRCYILTKTTSEACMIENDIFLLLVVHKS